ncbi:ATP-binding protein [Propionivibrio sp.]|uniref:ATP-binding protein n=1 Tax=Propionivibrio sp. TaxID=2212460 RepID=UPI003BF02068
MNTNIFQWHSIKTRVTFLTLAIFLVSIWLLSYFASRMLHKDMERLLGAQQFSTASMVADQVNNALESRLKALEKVAGTSARAQREGAAAMQALIDQRPILQTLFNGGILVLSVDGTVAAEYTSSARRIGVNYMDLDVVAAALKEGQSTIGRPFIGKVIKSPVIAMAAPIFNAQGKVIGALMGVTYLSLPNFLDGITEGRYGQTGGYLINAPQYRLIVTSSDKARIMETLPAPGINPLIDRFIEGYEGSAVFVNPAGVEVLASVKGVPVAGWYVTAQLPSAEAFAPIRDMQQRMLLATILLTLLAGGLTWWVLQRQLSPMLVAARTLTTLSDTGQPSQPLPIARPDEIGQLIGGFNRQLEIVWQREKALRESEAFNQVILNSVAARIVVLNHDGVIMAVNEPWRRFALENGIAPGKPVSGTAVGDNYLAIFKDSSGFACESAVDAGAGISAVLDGRLPSFFLEYECHTVQQQRWLSMSVTPLGAAGQDGVVIAHTDITEHRLANAALDNKRTLFDAILQGTTDAIYAKDLEGRYLLFNRTAGRMVGKSEEEVLGKDDYFLFPPAEAKIVIDGDRKVLAGESAVRYEEVLTEDTGRQITLLTTKGPIFDRSGKKVGLFGNTRDITERKEAETRLTQALIKAEAATLAKSEFLAHMSHEIRTPMNAIVGAARLIEYESLTPRQLGYCQIMQNSSQSLLALIDNILDLSKIEAGHIELKKEPFDLARIVDGLAGVASVAIQDKAIEISFDLAPDLPPLLIGDHYRLEQVLNNLLSNAIKFTTQGKITLQVLKVSADAEKARLLFALSDTGIGISPEKLDAIFDAFVQAESTTIHQYSGTGLGLAICRQLVELMGGTLVVESVPGEGSRFSFMAAFPLPQGTEAVLPTVPLTDRQPDYSDFTASISPLAGCRVLMVEDNQFNRQVLEGMLHHFGIEVDAAIDGNDGVKRFQAGSPYDAILMDLHLPRINGFDCARAIRALPEGQQVPIIALTANVLSTTADQCRAAGMNEHLSKPVEPEMLHRSLMSWILGETAAAPAEVPPAKKEPADLLPDNLPGIEREKALAWCNGSARALVKLLDRMLAHSGEDPAKISQHLATGDLAAAAKMTHDLVAVAATIGASPLVAAARQLDREIRAGSPGSTLAQEAIDSIGSEFSQLYAAQEMLRVRVD